MMEKQDIEYFRNDLILQKTEILREASKTLNSEMVVADEELPDTIDRSTMETDRNFTLRLRDRDRKLLKKVEEALERIDSDTFGICEECAGEIGVKRLKVRAVATLCIACKEEQEEQEKHMAS